ncbi:MAG: hypothetical protein AAFP77_24850 [Bacteroidota bacterium]
MWYPQGSVSDEQLYTQCQQLLSAGQPIELRWDCGGDEAIIYLMEKSKSLNETNPEFVSSLTLYLANYLELPDVGEFSMKGQGTLSLKDEDVIITFESIMEGYVDYDPDSDTASYLEINEVEPDYSGELKLFQ